MPKYEYLTKKDLGYKADAVEKVNFEYSPIGKVFTDGLAKEDKSKKVGLFKRLKNIADNLVEADDNDNKVDIFKIIKDIKDKGIKIDNDNEAIREIRERIKELIDEGVKVNSFDEIKEEIMEHIKNLKDQGINVRVDEDQINDLINKISDMKNKDKKNTYMDSEIDKFLKDYRDENINISYDKNKKSQVVFYPNQKEMRRYVKSLKDIVDLYNLKSSSDTSKKGEGLKILSNKQILDRLPILLAQIQAGNNSKKLKNGQRQILYSLYRSKALTKTVYNDLIKVIRAEH